MISQGEMLELILNDDGLSSERLTARQGYADARPLYETVVTNKTNLPSFNYDLRLVRESDGRLSWKE